MTNMNYCRWENTYNAMQQCFVDWVEARDENPGLTKEEYREDYLDSAYERASFDNMLELCELFTNEVKNYQPDYQAA
jgi:hypothetical protein